MTAQDAINKIMAKTGNFAVFTATGFISRFAQDAGDKTNNFYIIGSMGMVSSIALGFAMAHPTTNVVALDGDGSMLMNLGHLPMASALRPENFYHIVIDNETYESTGGQRSYSSEVNLCAIATSCGYHFSRLVHKLEDLDTQLDALFAQAGPAMLVVKVSPFTGKVPERIRREPDQITNLFKKTFERNSQENNALHTA